MIIKKSILIFLPLLVGICHANDKKMSGQLESAQAAYQRIITQNPNDFGAYIALADIVNKQENYEQEIAYLQKAVSLHPLDYLLHFRIGNSYGFLGKIEQAIKAFSQVLKHEPNHRQTLYNIAFSLKISEQPDQAIELFKKILLLYPDYDDAQFGLGMAYLIKGDFENGWRQHEHYLKRAQKNSDILRSFLQTNNIKDKIILVCPEGGIGDTFMHIRYVKLLKDLGAQVVVAMQKSLIPLLSNCPYIDILLPLDTPMMPHHDNATLVSLPAIFHSTENTIPNQVPYIFADQGLVEKWAEKLSGDKKFKIGLCWQADVFNDSSRTPAARRGIPLEQFYKLGSSDLVSLYSLQQRDGVEQLEDIPTNFNIHVFEKDFDTIHGSFCDTAAVMKNLDLIITVDTAIAHLAGGLGMPVWLLLPYVADWRWIAGRTTSPWYPTMRIFKQPKPFDWDSVMQDVCNQLSMLRAKQ